MSTTGQRSKRPPKEIARAEFTRVFGDRPHWLARAPGRVNLIGGHVDYSGGLVLPAAITLDVAVAFRESGDRRVRIHSVDFDEVADFVIDDLTPGSVQGWAAYPAGVAWALTQVGLSIRGMVAAVAGNLPVGAGLSSSAAVEVAFATAFCGMADLEIPQLKLAQLAQTAENQYVGVNCGIMDQVTSACGQADQAILLDCRSLELRYVPLPPGLRIVILDSGVKRQLRSSGYNQRRRECEEVLARLSAVDDDIRLLRDVSPDRLGAMLRHLPDPLDRRLRHVVGEIERVQLAASALEHNETERFGELMFASHRSSREDFQVSTEKLDTLVGLAADAPGNVGARLTGAGFGGCTVNLVSAALVDDFIDHVVSGYQREYNAAPAAYVSDAARGATAERIA